MNWDLVVIFTFVIVLVAVRSHYRREEGGAGLTASDRTALERAQEVARRLEQRVESLERVLDEDAPGWRARARA